MPFTLRQSKASGRSDSFKYEEGRGVDLSEEGQGFEREGFRVRLLGHSASAQSSNKIATSLSMEYGAPKRAVTRVDGAGVLLADAGHKV